MANIIGTNGGKMAVVGNANDTKRLDMNRLLNYNVAVRNKLTGYHINREAHIDIFYEGVVVSSIVPVIKDNRPYFYVDKDLKAYTDFEVAYKEAMTQNGYPVYYKKVM